MQILISYMQHKYDRTFWHGFVVSAKLHASPQQKSEGLSFRLSPRPDSKVGVIQSHACSQGIILGDSRIEKTSEHVKYIIHYKHSKKSRQLFFHGNLFPHQRRQDDKAKTLSLHPVIPLPSNLAVPHETALPRDSSYLPNARFMEATTHVKVNAHKPKAKDESVVVSKEKAYQHGFLTFARMATSPL